MQDTSSQDEVAICTASNSPRSCFRFMAFNSVNSCAGVVPTADSICAMINAVISAFGSSPSRAASSAAASTFTSAARAAHIHQRQQIGVRPSYMAARIMAPVYGKRICAPRSCLTVIIESLLDAPVAPAVCCPMDPLAGGWLAERLSSSLGCA
jgi:hypothetical protein